MSSSNKQYRSNNSSTSKPKDGATKQYYNSSDNTYPEGKYGKIKDANNNKRGIKAAEQKKREVLRLNKKKVLQDIKKGRRKVNRTFVNEVDITTTDNLLLKNISATADNNNNIIIRIFTKQILWIASVSMSTSWAQVALSSAQMVLSMEQHFSDDIFKNWKFLTQEAWINEFDDTGDITKVLDRLKDFKNKFSTFENTPLYKGLSKLLILMSLSGIISERKCKNQLTPNILEAIFDKWENHLHYKSKSADIIDVVLDSIIFGVDVLEAMLTGTSDRLIMPGDVMAEVLKLLSLEQTWRNGYLHDQNLTPEMYEQQIKRCVTLLGEMRKTEPGLGKMVYERHIVSLSKILHDMKTKTRGIRMKAPAATICLVGASQIGKSGLMVSTWTIAGSVLNFPTEDENIFYSNISDKYESGYDGTKTVYVMDDAAAVKVQYEQENWRGKVINLTNVQPTTAVKAELEEKGMPMNHLFNIISSNNRHLNYLATMNSPEACFNRIKFVEVTLLPQYADSEGRIDSTKIGDNKDLWRFRVFEWIQDKHGIVDNDCPTRFSLKYGPVMNTFEYYAYVAEYLKKHRESGEQYLKFMNTVRSEGFCPDCNTFRLNLKCKCSFFPEPQEISDTGEIKWETDTFEHDPILVETVEEECPIVQVFVNELDERIVFNFMYGAWMGFITHILANFVNMIDWTVGYYVGERAESVVHYVLDVQSIFVFRFAHYLMCVIQQEKIISLFILFPWLAFIYYLLLGFGFYSIDILRISTLISLWFMYLFMWRLKSLFVKVAIADMHKQFKGSNIETYLRTARVGVAIGTTVVALLSIKTILSSFCNLCSNSTICFQSKRDEGNIMPTTREQVKERKDVPDVWLKPACVQHPRRNETNATSTLIDIKNKYARNLVRLSQEIGSRTISTNALFIKSNVLLLNNHAYEKFNIECVVDIKRNAAEVGGYVPGCYLSQPTYVAHDLIIVKVSKCGPYFDALPWFYPGSIDFKTTALMLSREVDGQLVERTLTFDSTTKGQNATGVAPGSVHQTDVETKFGDCGSIVYMQGNPFYILGIHCGGTIPSMIGQYVAGQVKLASCFTCTRDDLTTAIEKMNSFHNETYIGRFLGCPIVEPNEPQLTLYGSDPLTYDAELAERDCMNFISPDTQGKNIYPIGSVAHLRFKRHSKVKKTLLSDELNVLGRPSKWGKPQFKTDRNHQESLYSVYNGMDDISPRELAFAIEDWLRDVESQADDLGFSGIVQPLTIDQAVNGIPGERFINRMPMNTSPGFGLSSPKQKHFIRTEQDGKIIDSPEEYITAQYESDLRMLMRGIPPRHLFSSALKDEPTKFDKTKVRVFQVGTVSMTMLTRQYTLPILDFLFTIPCITEMAQGVNCVNDEWNQLGINLFSFSDMCLEGDFSTFDASISGQMIRAVGYIFCRLATRLGYTSTDIKVLETIFSENSFKAMLYNGSIFDMDRMVPSGISITVFMNGIINGLLHRIAYIRLWKLYETGPIVSFRTNVRLLTMGDDLVGTTIKEWFNMRNLQIEFSKLGLRYTDGRKSQIAIPFFKPHDIRFCKRAWFFNEHVNMYVAPIELDSIYKSIHCYMETETNPLDVLVGNVEQALRELALHSSDVYYEELHIIKTACERCNITHLVKYLDFTYEDWWVKLYPDYCGDLEMEDVSPLTLSEQTENSV